MPDLTPCWYGFCDVTLALSARCHAAMESFDRAYGAFRVSAPDTAPLACYLDTDETGRGQVVLDGLPHPIGETDPGSAFALSRVFDHVAARSHTHLFLHAAAVSIAGRGLLLAGPSGHGKSTLAQALADGGADLLCDDTAPLDVAAGTVESFSIRCVEPAPARNAPVAAVFLLAPPQPQGTIHLALDHVPPEWERTPPWGDPMTATLRQAAGHWELLVTDPASGLLSRLEAACRACGVTILRDLGMAGAQFSETCVLTPLTRAEALPQLIAHLFGRGDRPLTELTWTLASALRQAHFWQLRPGVPGQTAAEVLRVMERLSH